VVADPPLVVVDGANVVGSVPDGWWRDRFGAAERLRDSLVPIASSGVGPLAGPVDGAAGRGGRGPRSRQRSGGTVSQRARRWR
jgi:hypothetical protein